MSRVIRSCDQAVLAHAEHIRQLGQQIDDAYARGQEGVIEGDRFNAELDKITHASWSTPPRSIADLYIRAEIARYWHQDVGEPWDKPDDCDDWGNRAVAELITAVFEMGASSGPSAAAPGKHITSASKIDFDPILGSDGKPIEFNFSNVEFADAYCPWIRMAFLTITRDREGVHQIARNLVQDPDDPEAEALFDMLNAWEVIENRFAAISKFASVAWARMVASLETLEEQDPRITKHIGPGVDRYLAKRGGA